MTMFKSVGFSNYRCFKDIDSVELFPLTVLCGINSSGKSSIINSLLIQKQSYESHSNSNFLRFSGDYVKSGLYSDVVTKHNIEKDIVFRYSTVLDKVKKYKPGTSSNRVDVTAYKSLYKLFDLPRVDRFVIAVSTTVSYTKGTPDNFLSAQKIVIKAISNDEILKETAISLEKSNWSRKNYDITLDNFPGCDQSRVVLRKASCYFENCSIYNVYAEIIEPKDTQVSELLGGLYSIYRILAMQFSNVHFLTPLRVYPRNNYFSDGYVTDVGSGGENTPEILASFATKRNTKFCACTSASPNFSTIESLPLVDHVWNWMDYIGFKNCGIQKDLDSIRVNVDGFNISNVGFGASQVLPIVTEGILMNPNELLCLEQPEIHLHPKAQMAMADFLIATAMSQRGLIVETHSDHIINRLVRRIMEDPDIAKIVRIYFVDQVDGISKIEPIEIDSTLGVVNENENFFTQFASETEQIMLTGYKNARILQ